MGTAISSWGSKETSVLEMSAWEIYTAASQEIWIVAAEVTEKHVWETMICSLPYHHFYKNATY